MFAGHVGVAPAAARPEPCVDVGIFAAASLQLDLLLGLFVSFGQETGVIPADFQLPASPTRAGSSTRRFIDLSSQSQVHPRLGWAWDRGTPFPLLSSFEALLR